MKGINGAWAGAIVGLPESHVSDIVLKNVNIQAKKGLQIGYADVTTDGLVISTTGWQPASHLWTRRQDHRGEEVERSATDGGIERGLNFGRAFSCDAQGLAAAGGSGERA